MLATSINAGFFDQPAVIKALDAATRRAFSKYGAFVRQRAKTSIRSRQGISRPGQPPFSHAGHLKRLIFFAFDANTKSVVIGPTLFRSPQIPTAPESLEFGGLQQRPEGGTARYAPRPFMRPAEQAERKNLADLLRDKMR